MKLSLGFSPCPNDTFMMDAMIHGKVDTEGLRFDVCIDDVEALNQKAFRHELDITKMSYHAFAYAAKDYVLLTAGSALGNNCGPLLIAKSNIPTAELTTKKIAIPGKYTTANFLLSLALPEANNKVEMLFSDIEEAVLNETVDAGVIIHENRFTYHEKGLKKLMDLGEYWEKLTQAPIPLGGIAVKRTLPSEVHHKINRVLKRSIEFAFQHPDSGNDFVKQHAKEMEEDVIKKHITLYVNNFSLNLGQEGERAVKLLYEKAKEKHIVPAMGTDIFITPDDTSTLKG